MAGNQTRNQGLRLEKLLDLLHDRYYDQNLALVWHAGVVAENYAGRWVPRKSLPDYQGILPGGRFVSFDAKSVTVKTSYSHPKSRMHQCKHLYEVQQAGGVAFLLLVDEQRSSGYAILPEIHWKDTEHGWSLRFSDAKMLSIPGVYWSREYIPNWSCLTEITRR